MLSYGAVGARQPAVRAALPLPVPARIIADAAGLPSSDTSTLLLQIVRVVFGSQAGGASEDGARRTAVRRALGTPIEKTSDTVPLPLDPGIWRETILQQQVPDRQLVAAILDDRRAALLYHGLASLDDETLAWLGPDRETLLLVRQQSALFATFGRSIHVRGGRVLVPGGSDAEPLWAALTGVDPERPAAFVQRIFRDDDGKLAFLYDAVAHLDPPRQRFALGLHLPASSRDDRFRALLEAFTDNRWQPSVHPFSRPLLDASVLLSTMAVSGRGEAAGPMVRRIWERVFHNDTTIDVPFTAAEPGEAARDGEAAPIDAAWLASRISRVPYTLGRRRLDTILFAQRVFGAGPAVDPAPTTTALRGFASFPALMLTLERLGATQTSTFTKAAHHAVRLGAIESLPLRRASVAGYQSALGIVERAHRAGALTRSSAQSLANSLAALGVSPERGYEGRLSGWLRNELLRALPLPESGSSRPAEASILAAIAGVRSSEEPSSVIQWEGARYRVDPAGAELRRLWRVRERQGGLSLDAALAAAADGDTDAARRNRNTGPEAGRALAETLASILYAAYLGDPDGPAVTSGNVALRHDLALSASPPAASQAAWELPTSRPGPTPVASSSLAEAAGEGRPGEDFTAKTGWRVRGSLLGLESALARLALRRLDPTRIPPAPKLSTPQRQTVALGVALLNPFVASNSSRDEIAAALARGRARASALTADPGELDMAARAAGLSEWRRQALAWTIEHDPGAAASRFSLPELFWLGGPRPSAIQSLDAWGAAALPLTGCMCLQMPATRAWEEKTGRSATGLLATQAVDVSLQVADALASLQLPAALAPAILSFAAQDVLDRAQPAYPDDWNEFGHAARTLSRDHLMDYIAALTANGPLVPAAAVPTASR
jgi:hypothetical protein